MFKVIRILVLFLLFCEFCPMPLYLQAGNLYLDYPQELINNANIIVKGKVVSVEKTELINNEHESFQMFSAAFRIDKIIKGNNLPKEISIEFSSIPISVVVGQTFGAPPGINILKTGEYDILFLQKQGNHYIFNTSMTSELHAVPTSPKITFGKIDINSILAEEMFNNLANGVDFTASLAILDGLRMPGIIPYIKPFANTEDLRIKAKVYAILIHLKDFSCLEQSMQLIKDFPWSVENMINGTMKPDQNYASYQVTRAINESVGTETTVYKSFILPILYKFTNASNTALRRSVFESLRKIKDETSMPFFIQGLKDADREVRWTSLAGLARVTGKYGEWAPGYMLLNKDESQYIKRWQNWWETEGKKKYEKQAQ